MQKSKQHLNTLNNHLAAREVEIAKSLPISRLLSRRYKKI